MEFPTNLNFNIPLVEWKLKDPNLLKAISVTATKLAPEHPLSVAISWIDEKGEVHYVIKKNCKMTSKYNADTETETIEISESP
jgi:hypothetical protein